MGDKVMYKKIKPLFLICETPLHAGSGSDLGIVDLPIQRERSTDYPEVESSSLKGSIRMEFENIDSSDKDMKEKILLSFGPEKGDYAASLGFTDARLLLFPVKSMKGVYAWVTCEDVLQKFRDNLNLCNVKDMPAIPDEKTVPEGSNLIIKTKDSLKAVLEEYTFDIEESKECSKLAEWIADIAFPKDEIFNYRKNKLKKDLIVLDNNDFRDFVNLSTEVITRTKISAKTGTVETGALFTEEYLPVESILYSLVMTSKIFTNKAEDKKVFSNNGNKKEEELVMEFFEKNLPGTIQLGGNATIGKGLITTHVYGGEK